MLNLNKLLEGLSEGRKNCILELFGSVELLYDTVYLVVQNEHVIQNTKPENWEAKLENIKYYRSRIEGKLSALGLDAKDIVADIANDYFEDYVNFRAAQHSITQAQFVEIIKRLQ